VIYPTNLPRLHDHEQLIEQVTNEVDVTTRIGDGDVWHEKWSREFTELLFSNANYRSTESEL